MPDQTAPHLSEWLTVKQVGRTIAASSSYVRKAIGCGKLRAANITLGGARAEWRVSREALLEFMRAAAASQKTR